jgi:hypothetical protein
MAIRQMLAAARSHETQVLEEKRRDLPNGKTRTTPERVLRRSIN